MPDPPSAAPSPSSVTLGDLVKRHGTQTRAARAWGVSQSAISRLLSGARGGGDSEVLRAISEVEGIPIEQIELPVARKLGLVRNRGHQEVGNRFRYNKDEPIQMLHQVQNWFADLPAERGIGRRVLRAVMRTLLDETFDEIHKPSRSWRLVMDHVEGWPLSRESKRGVGNHENER
jgi:hypothetical protein